MLFDAISQAFLTAAGTSCVTNPSNRAHDINPCSLQGSTNNTLAARGHFTPIGKAHSCDWAAADQEVWWQCRRADYARHAHRWQRQSRARTGPLNTAQEPLLPFTWSSEGHHTPAYGFHSSHPGKASGKVSPGWLVSQWLMVGFLSLDFRCPSGVSQCGDKSPLQPCPLLCSRLSQ